MITRLAHTADLDAATRTAARTLLDAAFDGDFTDEDWAHGLGGMHVLCWEGDELTGHASLVQRQLLHRGRALRTGYVENVAVREDRRGRGYGAALMSTVERLIRGGYELGALSSSSDALEFYGARGWVLWRGPTSAFGPDGLVRTEEDDGGVFVLPVSAALDPDAPLACDWREGDVW
ncbi:GNAT family N-acetyltransferase [Amycolatopsis samaneae]|uniref:GNAT family N-acetyltransferase n=1 Tax=Amycolatopsis samaneae TaxID=664691 RepID=A0ABW5G9F9_9PSEU